MAKKAANLRNSGEEPSFWEKPITEHSEELVETMKKFVIGARTEKGAAYQPMSLKSFWYNVKRHTKSSNDGPAEKNL